jgi:hypothetical protein
MAGTKPFQTKKGATGRRQVDSKDGWPNADNSAYVAACNNPTLYSRPGKALPDLIAVVATLGAI